MRFPLALALAAVVAVFAISPAVSAANHDKGGAKTYTLDKKLKKMSGKLAIGLMAQDLGKRLGTKITSVKSGTCTGTKKKKSCSYTAQDAFSKALGSDTLYCATGTIKLVKRGRGVKINQTAKTC